MAYKHGVYAELKDSKVKHIGRSSGHGQNSGSGSGGSTDTKAKLGTAKLGTMKLG